MNKSKWHSIEGYYAKPSECATIKFLSTNRESLSWRCLQKIPSKKSSFTTRPTSYYGVEINGLPVGLCDDINLERNILYISKFVERDNHKLLCKLDEGCSMTVVNYLPDGSVARIYEFYNAVCNKKWMGNLEISFSKKTIRC